MKLEVPIPLLFVLLALPASGQGLGQLQQKADGGDVSSMLILAMRHYEGEGTRKNLAQAYKYFQTAAEKGNAEGMFALGMMYSRGIGVEQSSNQAAQWTLRAAELGHAHSQYAIAVFYRTGSGIVKSFPDSVKWLTSAALSGHQGAQMVLAQHYRAGDIVGQDLVQAYVWFNIADSKDTPNASVNREIVAGLLTPPQLEQAQSQSTQIYQKVSQAALPLPVILGGEVQNSADTSLNPHVALPQYVPPAAALGRVKNFTIPGVGLEMIKVSAGEFLMGSPASEKDRKDDETQHRVRLTQPFWLGKYEVTQGQWKALMGSNPSQFKGDDLPVEMVSWEDAMAFCRKLNQMDGNRPSGYVYSLPTEAQWEYACRAGTTTATAFGDSLSSRDANFDGDNPYGGAAKGPKLGKTAPVGSYRPNAWGFYDLHGNVREWCSDWYGDYPSGSVTNPAGPSSGSSRVHRGGSWNGDGGLCRSANRSRSAPGYRFFSLGFRPSLRSE